MGLRNGLIALYFSMFLSFHSKLKSQFFLKLCKLQSSNIANIFANEWLYRGIAIQADCFGSFMFSIFFFSSPISHVSNENLCHSFLRNC